MKTRSVMTLLFLALSCSSCDDTTNLPPTTPGGGFYVQTLGQDNTSGFGVPFATYGINVQGVWDHDNASCLGTPVGDASTWNLNSSNTSLIMVGGDCMMWVTVYDHGTVSITVNGVVSSVSYSQYSTSSTIATDLANTINANTSINTLVSATAWGTQVLINVTQSGSHYSLSATAASSDTGDFPDGSFSAYASAPTL